MIVKRNKSFSEDLDKYQCEIFDRLYKDPIKRTTKDYIKGAKNSIKSSRDNMEGIKENLKSGSRNIYVGKGKGDNGGFWKKEKYTKGQAVKDIASNVRFHLSPSTIKNFADDVRCKRIQNIVEGK